MRTIFAKTGPFSERPYFSDVEIDKLCVDELKKLDLYPSKPTPIRIDWFIEKRFGAPHSYQKLPDGVLGYTLFGRTGVSEIVIAEDLEGKPGTTNDRRLRATLAHEAGHGLMHAYLFALGNKPVSLFDDSESEVPQILCRDVPNNSTGSYNGRWWELQANKAIGALLLPRRLVEQVAAPFAVKLGFLEQMIIPDTSREKAVSAISNVFNVNPAVARIRLGNFFVRNSQQLTL